jgi:hypothetical protein
VPAIKSKKARATIKTVRRRKKAPVAKSETLLFLIPRVIWNQFFANFFA